MDALSDTATLMLAALVIGLLLRIAWYDFKHLVIGNGVILLLLGIYVLWAALLGFQTVASDLAAGAILFLPAFAMWLMRLMGAGDVKLYFALGLFMGFGGLPFFALALLGVTLTFLLVLSIAQKSQSRAGVLVRLREFKTSGQAPYGVIMCCAAIPVIAMRFAANA